MKIAIIDADLIGRSKHRFPNLEMKLPIKFKIDSEQMAADIQAAVNQITDVEINLRVNTDSLRSCLSNGLTCLQRKLRKRLIV